MGGVDLGTNRQWLVNSHMSGTARREDLDAADRVEALIIYRDQLMEELRTVEQELSGLAQRLQQGAK